MEPSVMTVSEMCMFLGRLKEGDMSRFLALLDPKQHAHLFKSEINPTGQFARVEILTPERAEEALSTQENVRKPNRKRIEKLKESQRKGEMVLTPQGISYSYDGKFRDGQHRSYTVLETGIPMVVFVTYNVTNQGTLHLDEQMPRSLDVGLRAAGLGNYSKVETSTISSFMSFPKQARKPLSKEEAFNILRLYSDAISFSTKYCKKVDWKGKCSTWSSPIRCLVTRAYDHIPLDRLEQFCRVMRTGEVEHPSDDQAAVKFRNYMLQAPRTDNSNAMMECYRKGQNALMRFSQRKTLEKLYATEEDLFPIVREFELDAELE